MSGGGVKAAVFSAEALFYLDALGLMQRTSVLSGVSGGSFAAALYALSCDQDDPAGPGCQNGGDLRARGLARPIWNHAEIMRTVGQGYRPLIAEQVVRWLVPLPAVRGTISAGGFAKFVDSHYFGTGSSGRNRFLFSDLNPRRPHLALNSTILSANRGGLGSSSPDTMGCHGDPAVPRGWLRRRNPDEFFHFAYTDLYFGLLRSNLRDFPVAGAVAASAAFPLLIDNARLEDFCRADGDKDRFLALMDGGANDNQGMVEIYHILAELVLGQRRSDVPPMQLERLGPQDTAYILVVNSSVTDSTGPTGSGSSSGPPGLIGFFSGAVTKSLEGVDVYSATSYNLRKNLYVNEAARVVQLRGKARIRPIEIGLNGLDQYGRGGLQAALWEKSGLLRPPTEPEDADPAEKPLQERAQIRRAVLARVMPRATRRSLALSDLHPQCYYDIRARLDASLVSLGEDEQACLREAARWSTALAAQELCEVAAREPREKAPDGLCEGGLVSIQRRSWVLGADEDVGRRCAKVLEDAKVLVPASSAREDECRWLND